MYTSYVFLLTCFVIGTDGTDSRDIRGLFVQKQFNFNVQEDSPLSTIVGQIKTWKAVAQLVLYGNEAFVLDGVSGNILTTRSLDYEQRQSYNLLVKAKDPIDSKTETVRVKISITDVNEAPKFLQTNYDATVSSNFPVGGHATTVSAVDQDSGPAGALLYVIQPESPYFSINSVNGNVFTQQSLRPGTYTVPIVATDMGFPRLSTTTLLGFHVTEDSVQRTQDTSTTCGQTSLDVSVMENASPGTSIVQLKDRLPKGKGYLISGGSGRFAVTTDNNLVVTSHLDFETQRFYDLIISTQDDTLHALINIRITIIDVNDFPPMFFGLLSPIRIPSTLPLGKTVYGVTAWDGDQPRTPNSKVSYSLVHTSDAFLVNGTTGELILKKSLESKRIYLLRIMANDGGSPSLQGFTDIEINTFNPTQVGFPVFESPFITVSLAEHQPIGTRVYTVSAANYRAGDLVYSIIGASAQTMFSINSSTGVIATRVMLDRDLMERTALVVRATNKADNSLNNDMMVYVEIADINNHPPVFPFHCLSSDISRNILPGTIVFRPQATDQDISSTLTYGITEGNQDDIFDISDGAIIRVKKRLTNQVENTFNLTLSVSDSVYNATTKLIVNVA